MRSRGKVLSLPAGTLLGLLLYVGLLVIPASASAAGSHVFKEIFGSANQPEFKKEEAEGMAIDPSGNLLVIDQDTATISRWAQDGTPVNFPVLGTNVIDHLPGGDEFFFTGPESSQIAVDSSGHIYVPQFQAEETAVYIFNADGSNLPPLTESSEGELKLPCGVALDASDNLYVGDISSDIIHKFEPSGGLPENGNSQPLKFKKICNIAAGVGPSDGFIFPVQPEVEVSKNSSSTGAEEYPVDSGSIPTAAIDPNDGHLYVAKGEEIAEFDVSGPTPEEIEPPILLDSKVRGLAINGSTGNIYVTRASSKNIEVFGPRVSVLPLTIVKGGTGGGTVKSEPPEIINCGPSCPEQTGDAEEGKPVPLKAKGAAGSVFTGWVTLAGDPGTCTGAALECAVPMSEATELEAVFDLLPSPTVETLNPNEGPTGGGNLVEITGENLGEATQVEFGNAVVKAPFIEKTATKLKLKAPNHIAGAVNVIVTTTSGTSANTPSDDYTYIADPHVTALSPNTGPTGGGNEVQITGTSLAKATQVEFGGTVVNAPFTENTDTAITLTAPAHPAGTVSVQVRTAGGASLSFPANNNYTFAVPPPPPPPEPPFVPPLPEPLKVGSAKVAPNASFSGGKASLKVSCDGNGACSGKITLKAKIKGKNRVIGSSSYNLGAGKSKTIQVRITDAQAKKRLKEGKAVTARFSGPGLRGTVRIKPSGG